MLQRFGAFLAPMLVAVSLAACGGAATAIPTPPPTIIPTGAPTTIPTVAPTLVATPTGGTSRATPSAPAARTASGPTSAAGADVLVKDPQGHFTFSKPKGWSLVDAKPDKLVRLTSSAPSVDLLVQVTDNQTGLTLAQFFDKNQETNKTKHPEYVAGPLNGQKTTLDGEPAFITDVLFTDASGLKSRLYEIVMIRKGIIYAVITATDQPPTDPVMLIKPITDTWKWA